MGALLGLGLLFGALGLAFRRPARAEPAGMIGMPILRITSGVHILTITRHPQGYAWYVARGSDVLESSNEGSNEGAVAVGMESLQGYISASAAIRVTKLEAPEAMGIVEFVGAAGGPWKWTLGDKSMQEPSRPEAVMELLDAMEVPLEGAAADVPPLPEAMQLIAGIEIDDECTTMRVVDADAWVEEAAPIVMDALEAEIDNATELANAVFANTLECDVEGLTVDGIPWENLATGIQSLIGQMVAGQYLDTVQPQDKLAAALVGQSRTAVGQSGKSEGDAWVVVPYGSTFVWMVFEGWRRPNEEAYDSGAESTMVEARQAALNRIHEEPKTAALDEA